MNEALVAHIARPPRPGDDPATLVAWTRLNLADAAPATTPPAGDAAVKPPPPSIAVTPTMLDVNAASLNHTSMLVRCAGTAAVGRTKLLGMLSSAPERCFLRLDAAAPPIPLEPIRATESPMGSRRVAEVLASKAAVNSDDDRLEPAAAASSSSSASPSSSASVLSAASLNFPSPTAMPDVVLTHLLLPLSDPGNVNLPSTLSFTPGFEAVASDAPCFFDVLLYVSRSATCADVAVAVRNALVAHVTRACEVRSGVVRHFKPPMLPHPVTVFYPAAQKKLVKREDTITSSSKAQMSTLSQEALAAAAAFGDTTGSGGGPWASSSGSSARRTNSESQADPEGVADAISNVVSAATDEASTELRHSLHHRLLLPLARPCLRSIHSLEFPKNKFGAVTPTSRAATSAGPGQFLQSRGPKPLVHARDVHLSLRLLEQSQLAQPSSMFTVEGSYDYYHYLQDEVADAGWGCAYRSLQTLASWLLLNGLATRPPPLHAEIQRTLAAIGDKEASFVGSSKWIGAVEVGMVLEQLYGIAYRIVRLNKGSEIVDHLADLALHFEREGAPVMIGGGVLAYTLLGIDWNRESNDARFLILDPHYPEAGESNLATIRKKGWCAWKPPSLFLDDVFYNLCLPTPSRSSQLL